MKYVEEYFEWVRAQPDLTVKGTPTYQDWLEIQLEARQPEAVGPSREEIQFLDEVRDYLVDALNERMADPMHKVRPERARFIAEDIDKFDRILDRIKGGK